ncbi:MAG TPA: tyrosine-type recombinase/integrase [Chloroflexia bacterium]|nr:tyrosine-type recombinase/integrase [Chloroflexia bacterium]
MAYNNDMTKPRATLTANISTAEVISPQHPVQVEPHAAYESMTALVQLASAALEDSKAAEAVGIVIAGVLSEHSRRAYMGDIRHFLSYLAERGTALAEVNKASLVGYRAFLARGYAPSTVNRRLTVARRLVTEAWELGILTSQRNPADGRAVAGLKDAGDRGKPALTLQQARALLLATKQRGDLPALRDAALLHLLIGTGLRRSELASSKLADLQVQGGHNVLVVIGKGNKRRVVKLTHPVVTDIHTWLVAAARGHVTTAGQFMPSDPMLPVFSPIKRVGRGKEAHWEATTQALSAWGVWNVVTRRIVEAGLEVDTSPHGLRATFITLALEAGATISRVQDAAGHKDPRTTDRYRRRKASLDDNAADYVRLMGE